ncbi:MAG TPA: DUF3267 domain-containing protein [Dictyobacter sp.]|jgi:hypothetical protein|nr:DUF3267 domain-containing protein [Dictyobacter sp.]
MSLLFVDRYQPQRRQRIQAQVDAGRLYKRDELALLEQEQLLPLARLSLYMLIGSGIFFVALTFVVYFWHTHHWLIHLTVMQVLFWILVNVLGYGLILLLHELIHGALFAFWGGKPHFGTKLPLAVYCGARHQLFLRNAYLVVGLGPLVVITLAGIIFTLLAPGLASYALFATIGNFAGAAGDVWSVHRLGALPADILVEDTETGYIAWELAQP